jgi:hypothetical protein
MSAQDTMKTCGRCARILKRTRGGHVAPHRCPHGWRCVSVSDPAHCLLCRAVADVAATVLDPPCIFCTTTPRKIDCYSPEAARGGCVACGMPGGGAAGRSRHGDAALVSEIRSSMVDIFAGRR